MAAKNSPSAVDADRGAEVKVQANAPDAFHRSRGDDTDGRTLRDQGAADAYAAVHQLTRDAARRSIERWAASGRTFSGDQVMADVEDEVGDLPISGNPNFLGGAFLAAKNAGIIVPAGFTTSARASRHAGLQRLWVGVAAVAP